MTEQTPRTPSLKTKADEDGRSHVYLWVKRRRRHVASALTGQQPWLTIAREMAADGVLNDAGVPPTRKNALAAWKQLARERAALAEAKAKQPAAPPRSRRPNGEPPSRPGANAPVRPRSSLDAKPLPSECERFPHPDAAVVSLSVDKPIQAHVHQPLGKSLTGEERLKATYRELQKIDEYVPPPISKGRVV